MQSIVFEIPKNIAFQLRLPPAKAKQMLMEELVLRLYEQGIITSAQGAALLTMKRLRVEHNFWRNMKSPSMEVRKSLKWI